MFELTHADLKKVFLFELIIDMAPCSLFVFFKSRAKKKSQSLITNIFHYVYP